MVAEAVLARRRIGSYGETDDPDETSALTYRVGNEIVAIELDENCASNVIEPLMKKYGFENIKWLVTK